MTGPILRTLWLALSLPIIVGTLEAAQTGAQTGEWRHWGGDPGATRYTPLEEVTPDNVDQLEVAWRWTSANFGAQPETYYRATPLMVDGVLYTTAGFRRAVVAIEAATGETLWMWRMDEGRRGELAPRINSGRGVAYAEDETGQGRIYVVTPGFHMVALDARTGYEVEGFGKGGVIDLRETLEESSGRPVDRVEADIGSTSPPVIAAGIVVVGASQRVGLRPASRNNVPGYVQAFDANTGAPLWAYRTVPHPEEHGYETWEGGSAEYTGNANVWAPFTVDEELGLVYLPTAVGTNDYYGGFRHGDNLFANTLLAVDLQTGERVWHHQIVRHDIWDYDNPAAPILVDVEVDGQPVKAVAQLTKQSFVYVFDRVTGEPLWPMEEFEVGPSDIPGEQPAAQQLVPTKPPAFDRQGFTEEDLVDFTPEIRAMAEEAISEFRTAELFTPASLLESSDGTQGTLVLPGALGGANWEGGAVDPETGILYVGSMTSPNLMAMVEDTDSDAGYVIGRFNPGSISGIPLVKPPWGRISAIDLNQGEILWQVPNADTPEEIENHPLLEGVELPRTGRNSRAGLLVTRHLLFAGEGQNGTPTFRALDKATGEILWEAELPASQTGLPMAYELEGQAYVIVPVSGPNHAGELVAFRLAQ